jgi:hypothetical protein
MESIIKKYYLETGSKLVKHSFATRGIDSVDCWFDTNKIRQHRCLTIKDFNKIERS